MKTLLALLVTFAFLASAQDLPIIGKKYNITYSPQKAGILVDAKAITVVYVFDYWSTRATSNRDPAMLFYNVTHPDSARVSRAVMKKNDGTWKAEIEIHANASLLSYYFTGGEKSDYNQNNTYVSYLYNENGTPVRNARFRNIEYLNAARKGTIDQLAEISNELKDYPDNYVAYIPYWMLRFDTTSSTTTLQMLEKEANDQFDQLEKKLGATDSLMNVKAGVFYRYALRLQREGKGLEVPVVMEFKRIVKGIPPAKRFRYIQIIYGEWFGNE
jgi:hypothetical protein